MKIIRAGGRKLSTDELRFLSGRDVLIYVHFLCIHVRCRGDSAQGNYRHGLSSRILKIPNERKRMSQNNCLALWRPRFLQTISVGGTSISISFVFNRSGAGWTDFVNEAF
jgi:hypothetical protein